MKSQNLLFNLLTLCTLGLAGIAAQAVFHDPVLAEPQIRADDRDLLQRIMDLEDRQEQSDVDFHLVDQSLHDLDFRVDVNNERSLANKRNIKMMEARLQDAMKAIEIQKAEYRVLVQQLADKRAGEQR